MEPAKIVPTPTTVSDLAAISLSSKIPQFWTDLPRMWFKQFEAIVAQQKQGDTTKFNLVVAQLSKEALQQVSDILDSPPQEGKYETVKNRLLTVFEESAERQFQKLVGEMELGSQKPSQLLRKMRELARNTQVSDEALKKLWMSRLSSSVRAVLVVSQDTKLENLATMADKIVENMQTGEVAAVTSLPEDKASLVQQISEMTIEIKHLRGEVNAIRRGNFQRGSNNNRSRRPFRPRSRSRSTPRRTPESADWICRHHYRYKQRSYRCEPPCNWEKLQEAKQGN